MIATNLVEKVKFLLAERKFSQRKIARLTGLSRGSVTAIASRERRNRAAGRAPGEDGVEEPSAPLVRCGGCGGLVVMPCRFCMAEKARNESTRSPPRRRNALPREESLRLNLRPIHQARYEEVQIWRRVKKYEDDLARNVFCP